jgi:phenylalanyl-tRNA synthetase beta chain
MLIPLSWLKDYVDIQLSLEELAKKLTMAGLEVEGILLVGLPKPSGGKREFHEFSYSGLTWEPDKIVVAQIDEVMPHPNADRLVLCRLQDGQQEHVVLTGAPNLFGCCPSRSRWRMPARGRISMTVTSPGRC